jgi:hypothetical protein
MFSSCLRISSIKGSASSILGGALNLPQIQPENRRHRVETMSFASSDGLPLICISSPDSCVWS